MGFFEDYHPRHGHRTPSELAEDEILEALYGNVCAPGHVEQTATVHATERGFSANGAAKREEENHRHPNHWRSAAGHHRN